MRLCRLAVVFVGAVVVAACSSSINVNYDFDQRANFQKYKTFQWLSQPLPTGSTSAKVAMERNSLLAGRIERAVKEQLTAKGMTAVSENPDVYVTYFAGRQDKVDIQSWGYGYGYGRYGGMYGAGGTYGGGGTIDTYNYTEGTLIIDIVDASTKELAWRGTAQGVLDDNPTPQQMDENVKNVVTRILANYPPPK
jgi:hypothetical protein